MKRTLTYIIAAGALALAACFPVVASAGHGHGHGHDWGDDDGDDHGPSWAGHSHGGWYPGYGVYAAPSYGYYANPYQCFAPGYGWYPCPYDEYGY